MIVDMIFIVFILQTSTTEISSSFASGLTDTFGHDRHLIAINF
jgi:hypothetical protein